MARPWITVGDYTSSGGRVITGSPFTTIDGKEVARVGDHATCPLHKGTFPIVDGDSTRIIDGNDVALHGSRLACGCSLLSSQVSVYSDVPLSGPGWTSSAGSVAATTASSMASELPARYDEQLEFSAPVFGALRGVPYELELEDGRCVSGVTDGRGRTCRVGTETPQRIVRIALRDEPCELCGVDHGDVEMAHEISTSDVGLGTSVVPVAVGGIFDPVVDAVRDVLWPEPIRQPAVIACMREAWNDTEWRLESRHEEGGFFGFEPDGSWGCRRIPKGQRSYINLPQEEPKGYYKDLLVVGFFHTHPTLRPAVVRGRSLTGASEMDILTYRRNWSYAFIIDGFHVHVQDPVMRQGRMLGTHKDVLGTDP